MKQENKELKKLDRRLDTFKRDYKRMKPIDMPEKLGHILIKLGFLQNFKGFNLTK